MPQGEEIFDVVDEFDQITGARPRREVHALGLRHRAVHVLVFNSAGQLFLQKRSMAKDCHPGTWDSSSSGHLAQGEDYDECALREPEEELGLAPDERPERLFRIEACERTGWEFVWTYRRRAEGPFRLQPEEIETGDWFSPGEIDDWMANRPEDFAPAFALIWETLKAREKEIGWSGFRIG